MWVAILEWYGKYEEATTVYGLFSSKEEAYAFAMDKGKADNEEWEFEDTAPTSRVSQMQTQTALEKLDQSLRRMSESLEEEAIDGPDTGEFDFNVEDPPDSKLHRALEVLSRGGGNEHTPSRTDNSALIKLDQSLRKISRGS